MTAAMAAYYLAQVFPLALWLAFPIAGWKRVPLVVVTITVAVLIGGLGATVFSIWAAAGIGFVLLFSYAVGRAAASLFESRARANLSENSGRSL